MLSNSSRTIVGAQFPSVRSGPRSSQGAVALSLDRHLVPKSWHHRADDESRSQRDRPADNSDCAVKIGPSDAVMRRRETWDGMAAEFVQVTRYERMEFSFCAPCHLLAVYEQGERADGESSSKGYPDRQFEILKGSSRSCPLVTSITSGTSRAF
jgi:hypothetical protein